MFWQGNLSRITGMNIFVELLTKALEEMGFFVITVTKIWVNSYIDKNWLIIAWNLSPLQKNGSKFRKKKRFWFSEARITEVVIFDATCTAIWFSYFVWVLFLIRIVPVKPAM